MLTRTERNIFITAVTKFAEQHNLSTNNYFGDSSLSFRSFQNEQFLPDYYFDYSKFSPVLLKDFDLKESVSTLVKMLEPYIKYFNIKINLNTIQLHDHYNIILKPNYKSLDDVLYLEIQLISKNSITKRKLNVRWYFTPIKPHLEQYNFSIRDSDYFILHVYYKDIKSLIMPLLEKNKSKLHSILGYNVDHVNQDTVNLINMIMI